MNTKFSFVYTLSESTGMPVNIVEVYLWVLFTVCCACISAWSFWSLINDIKKECTVDLKDVDESGIVLCKVGDEIVLKVCKE